MSDMSLAAVENAANEAYQAYSEAEAALTAAEKNTADAYDALWDAQRQYDFGEMSQEEYMEYVQAWNDAQAEQEAAEAAKEAAAADAQAAADAIDEKKDELRENRENDTSYVVHCARIECPYGMRESYLALGPTHGVFTRQAAQMTTKDTILDTNIINFGGCHSKENPGVQEAMAAVDAMIESEKDLRDRIVEGVSFLWKYSPLNMCLQLFFHKDEKEEEDSVDDMRSEFVGECMAAFPADAEWTEGHEKVFVNGEAVLLRRCSIMCNYGGCITMLVSGQPE